MIRLGPSCSGTSIRAVELLGITEVSARMGQKIWAAAQSTPPHHPRGGVNAHRVSVSPGKHVNTVDDSPAPCSPPRNAEDWCVGLIHAGILKARIMLLNSS